MDALIPGRILVVDDVYKDVAGIVQKFREEGYGVIYREGPSDDIGELSNVRLVILDLDLKGLGPGTDLEWPALALQRLTESGNAFFLVAVWSKHVTNEGIPDDRDWLVELREAYAEQTGRPFPDLFLRPFRKQPEQTELLKRIEQWIMEVPHAGLVFEWERLLNRARDYATSGILDLEGGSLASLVNVLRKEVGESANRELVQLFNKVLLRYMTAGNLAEIRELMDRLSKDGDGDLKWYVKFHQFQAYYSLDDTEPVWTGDIWSTSEDDPEKQFAILITPACDLAQSKARYLKVAYAVLLEPWSRAKNKFRMGKGKAVAALTRTNPEPETEEEGQIIPDLPQNIYSLPFFPTNDTFSWLLVDLSLVEAVRSDHFAARGWKRICRLDSPYIEDLMHHYAALSERVGVPTIPEKIREAEAKRLRDV
jgi:hypothetical protein